MEFFAPAAVMIVLVVTVFSFIGGVLNMRHEERKLKLQAEAAGDAIAQDALAEIARLKERVAVLERLITDEDRRVAKEISRLGADARA